LRKMCVKMTNIHGKALSLIYINGKVWMSEKLGITRKTLDVRIDKGNWRKLEIEKIAKL